MTPTPPADAASSASPTRDERIKRSVACVNCRNSKVRCKFSTIEGRPCQRCAKLSLSCVVDKNHKRVTKRSKLEQLEQELKSIKQAVNPAQGDASSWTPPSPRTSYSTLSESNIPGRVLATGLSQVPTPLPEPPAAVVATERPPKAGPSQSRTLGDHLVSGEDIDWYFNKFLQCFHPYLPILRKRDPDDCFESCPTLFWVILYITCRRYTKDRDFFAMLAEHVGKDIWIMLGSSIVNMEGVHALLYLATWPLPTIRLVTDPTSTLVSVAMTNAMMMGLHTGKGSHPEFCIGARKLCQSTDEEAAATWVACCLLSQKVAATSGHPPPSIRLDDGPCKSKLDSSYWSDLKVMFDIEKYMNRFHTAVAAQITSTGGTSHIVVSMWESEFENVKPMLVPTSTEFNAFLSLAAQLQMQIFFFNTDPAHPNPSSRRINLAKAFHTSRALIATVLEQEARSKFLTHAPHWAFRIVVDAACIATSTLHSTTCPELSPNDAHVLAQQAFAAVHRCSVQENDLPHRAGVIIETFWHFRNLLPKLELGDCTWASRLSVGFTYWCLSKFKHGLQAAQRSGDNAAATTLVETAIKPPMRTPVPNALPPLQDQVPFPQSQPMPINDPLQDIDWNMLMDDFNWVNEDGVLLGLP